MKKWMNGCWVKSALMPESRKRWHTSYILKGFSSWYRTEQTEIQKRLWGCHTFLKQESNWVVSERHLDRLNSYFKLMEGKHDRGQLKKIFRFN
jgi:hypothetical protein